MLKQIEFILSYIKLGFLFPILHKFYEVTGIIDTKWYEYSEKIFKKYLNYSFNDKTNNKISEKSTIVLTNHRSAGDMFVDFEHIPNICVIIRTLATISGGFYTIFRSFTDSIIVIDRSNTKRKELIKTVKDRLIMRYNVMWFPEGTRSNYLEYTKNDMEERIKWGLLKSVWENGLKYQIVITEGKENVCNERKMEFNYNLILNRAIGGEIDSAKFETFDDFKDVFKEEWVKLWRLAYNT